VSVSGKAKRAKKKAKRKSESKMQPHKQNTILDKILKQKNAYMRNGVVFQRRNNTLIVIEIKDLLES